MELYRTIVHEASETQIIEKSRFIAHAKAVSSREEADEFIADIKAKYRDATHNVPALVLGDKFQIQWASDDGEPQGTSGAPIVQMLVKEGITDIVIVVTRYFGGIKLGTGGLVRAYTSSAKLALEAADVCSVQKGFAIVTEIDYTYLARLQKVAGDYFDIDDIQYGEKVRVKLVGNLENREKTESMLSNLTSGNSTPEKIDEILLRKVLT